MTAILATPRVEFPRAPQRQRGFTMIELMIALLIGLFLMGGLIGLVQSNKRAFTSQSQLAQLQDNERLALTMMNDVIQQAGYFPNPTLYTAAQSLAAVTVPVAGAYLAGQYITGIAGTAPTGDTVSVRYATATGDGILNCSGGSNTSGTNQSYANTFSVIASGNVSQLVCTDQSGTAYPLVNNVTNLTVTYGVNTSGSGNNVDTYMTTAQVIAAGAWNKVITAQVQLTFNNPLYPTAGQPQTLSITRTINIMSQSG